MKKVKSSAHNSKASMGLDTDHMSCDLTLSKKQSEQLISHEEMMQSLGLKVGCLQASNNENSNLLNANLADP